MDGLMNGGKSCFKDCLQQSKLITIPKVKNNNENSAHDIRKAYQA